MKSDNEFIGTIEEIVKKPKLVDRGSIELEGFSRNAPAFEPERRRFLKHAAVLAGLLASGNLSYATTTWEAYLLSQDRIRGPALLIHPETRRPSDFEHHRQRPINKGWGAVDYDVPIGTPIVPTADAFGKIDATSRGNIALLLVHDYVYRSMASHLDRFADVINRAGDDFHKLDRETILKTLQGTPVFNKFMIVAFSGATGEGPGPGGYQPPHLDFRIYKREGGRNIPPGLDPFTLGIDQKNPLGDKDQFGLSYGGRPVYWDGKTEITIMRNRRLKLLKESLDTLDQRLKEQDELDKATVQELLKRHNNTGGLRTYLDRIVPELEKNPDLSNTALEDVVKSQNEAYGLRNYLGQRVLLKKPSPDGKPRYEFMPGSLMYSLMLEFYNRTSRHDFIAMLPFISPLVKDVYVKANPGVRF